MLIDKAKCIGCKKCLSICPLGAISLVEKKVLINQNICVECGVCLRSSICPREAFFEDKQLNWSRAFRKVLSDPVAVYETTGVTGRGTEEMKTNDVTNRYQLGEFGIAIDVGRPNVGTKINDIQILTTYLAKIGVDFEENNPITSIMKDLKTGEIEEKMLGENLMSGIIEFKIPQEKLMLVLKALQDIESEVNTVFTVGIITLFNEDGNLPVISELERAGFSVSSQAKINIGLGYI